MMKEAMSKIDYDRQEQGLPPLKPVKVVVPEPGKPSIPNEITMKDIPKNCVVKLEHADRSILRNAEGILFIGYNVVIEFIKKKAESNTISGWMVEGVFLEFVRIYRKDIDQQVINW